MGIENYITRLCVQTAVYWGTPVKDGEGGFTFADAVEIKCHWEDVKEVLTRAGDKQGQELISKTRVYLTQDVEEQGYLYLGELDDLDSDTSDPRSIDGAHVIVKFNKTAAIRSTSDFLRKAYL